MAQYKYNFEIAMKICLGTFAILERNFITYLIKNVMYYCVEPAY